ncbi:MAG TPA: hypothetical protein VFO60_06925 [Candidatus Dormibacteraeota bacterium]|nr:hypothetical protein [Candidatus Dormibacteraeota bacterium]
MSAPYEPFGRGPSAAGVRGGTLRDSARSRTFPVDVWYPARADGPGAEPAAGVHPVALYCHSSGGDRRSATFLCTHLASHGYVVAAMDHSERVAPELSRREGETAGERAARVEAVVSSRVPDLRLLLDAVLDPGTPVMDGLAVDAGRVGLLGHSFGGWSVLAFPEADARARAIVAMAPGGIAHPRPGILPLTLTFAWSRPVAALILGAELDVPIPLDELTALFERLPPPGRMVVLRRADHQHFVDDVAGDHEAVRAMDLPPEAAWLPAGMLPASELCPAGDAHLLVRGLALAHLDAALRGSRAAAALLDGDVAAALAARGVDAFAVAGR